MDSTLKKSLLTVAIVALLVTLVSVFSQNKAAPNVVFISIEGKKIAMTDLKGKVVLVNFWATDCLPCVTEMPALAKLYRQYQAQGLEIIAVAMPYDPPAQVLNYVRIKKPPFAIMHDGLAQMSQQFGNVEVTPTTYIFNQQGKQIQRTIGALDFVKLEQLLSATLAKR